MELALGGTGTNGAYPYMFRGEGIGYIGPHSFVGARSWQYGNSICVIMKIISVREHIRVGAYVVIYVIVSSLSLGECLHERLHWSVVGSL